MAKAKRMLKLRVGETSGVDAPAHRAGGWLVVKDEAGGGDPIDDEIREVLASLEGEAEVDLAELLRDNLEALPADTRKAAEAFLATIDTQGGIVPDDNEALTKAEEARKAAEARASEAERQLAVVKAGGTLSEAGAGEDAEEAAFRKALAELPEPIAKAWEQDRARAREAERIAKGERDTRLNSEYVAKAAEFRNLPVEATTFGPVLRAVDEKLTKEEAAEIHRILKAADAHSSEFFSEVGGTGGAASGTAWDEIVSKAKEIQAGAAQSGNDMTFEKAVEKVYEIDHDLAKRYHAQVTGR